MLRCGAHDALLCRVVMKKMKSGWELFSSLPRRSPVDSRTKKIEQGNGKEIKRIPAESSKQRLNSYTFPCCDNCFRIRSIKIPQ